MYALLDKSQIKVGPRQYSFAFFREYLTEQSVEFDIPFDYNGTDAIIINDDIKIVRVLDPTIPQYNPLTEQLAGPYYNVSVDPITGYYDVAPRDVSAIQNELIALAASTRYTKENAGIEVIVRGQTVNVGTTKEERATWHQLLTIIGDETIKFKFSSTLWIDISHADVKRVVDAIASYVQNLFVWEAEIVNKINATTSLPALIAIKEEIAPEVTPQIQPLV
jgi:hypothetical protein